MTLVAENQQWDTEPYDVAFSADYGSFQSIADVLRQIGTTNECTKTDPSRRSSNRASDSTPHLPPTAERQSPQRCCGQPLVLFDTAQPIAVPAPMRAETATAGEAIATVPALARTPAYDSAVARYARAPGSPTPPGFGDIDTWSRSVVRHLSTARAGVSASPRRPIALSGPPVRACLQHGSRLIPRHRRDEWRTFEKCAHSANNMPGRHV